MSELSVLLIKEVAQDLQCKEAIVRQLIREGRLGAINVGGSRGIRVPVTLLEAFKANHDWQHGAPKHQQPAPRIAYTISEFSKLCGISEYQTKTLIQAGLLTAVCCGDFRRSRWRLVRIGGKAAEPFLNRELNMGELLSDVVALSKNEFFAKYVPHAEPPPDEVSSRSQAYRKYKDRVFKRDKYSCVYCGRKERLTLDHIIPVSRGGKDNFKNLATCCHWCNCSKKAKTPEEFLAWREARLS